MLEQLNRADLEARTLIQVLYLDESNQVPSTNWKYPSFKKVTPINIIL